MTLLKEPVYKADDRGPNQGCGVANGRCASTGVGVGPARVVTSKEDAARVRPGDVVIVPDSSPAWTSFFDKAVAVVAERGGELSAMAIAARERGVPLALCVKNAVELIQDGSNVLVNATAGKVRWHAAGHNTPYMCDLRRSQE